MILGIPNGSLHEATVRLLQKAGVQINCVGRKFKAELAGLDFCQTALILRPQDIPEAVADGMIDAGICGWDCVAEAGYAGRLAKIAELNYSRKSRAPARVAIFSLAGRMADGPGVLVATEYPHLTRPHFPRSRLVFSLGGTEQKVAYGKYDYGVGVVESGASLRDNGLREVATILVSATVLVAREDQAAFRQFGQRLNELV